MPPSHVLLQVIVSPGSNLATLGKLHWLPVHDCIKFKIATRTHKAI